MFVKLIWDENYIENIGCPDLLAFDEQKSENQLIVIRIHAVSTQLHVLNPL